MRRPNHVDLRLNGMIRLQVTLLQIVLALVSLSASALATPMTYVDLVQRLTSLESLAVLPLPGEKSGLASSYDRTSRYDETMGRYIRWDANADGNGIIRREGENQVLAEMTGPGCLWRIWSATPQNGHVKIYLDGAEVPVVDLPFKNYFDLSSAPFTYPALVHRTAANGFNSYVPIPYQKSCKIVADEGWGRYYQFTYSTFPQGTTVPIFTRDLGEKEKLALAAADAFLAHDVGRDPVELVGQRAHENTLTKIVTAAPGGMTSIADLAGPSSITSLRVKFDPMTLGDASRTLREMVLSIRWDDEVSPSVWVPLGDFFGSAPGLAPYKSLPLGLDRNEFYSYWFMPFARRAHLEILNESKRAVPLQFTLTQAPLTKPIETLGRFHAKWHRDADLPTDPTRKFDWTLLTTQGQGRFVGVMLHVWNPRGGWWGEGDEKFFVDGEKFPSTFGTGSEDYFGYAWSSMTPFYHALHNQPNVDSKSGNNSVNRWQIADNVPFQSSFDGSIEKYFPNTRPTRFTSTVYWYLSAGGSDPYGPVPHDERVGYFDPLPPLRVPGVLEGEQLKVLENTGGTTVRQTMTGQTEEWSDDAQLWWRDAAPGAQLTLALPVAASGTYDVKARFTKAGDYGIVQLSLDGQKIGAPQDLFDPQLTVSGELKLGQFSLAAGEHRLSVEIIGANEKAKKSYMFGLDYLKLDSVDAAKVDAAR
jgi:hypothetical protein